MIESVLKAICIFLYVTTMFDKCFWVLYYFQMGGYSFKSLFNGLIFEVKSKRILYIFNLLIFIFMLSFCFLNFSILLRLLIVFSGLVLNILLGYKVLLFRKINFTKRMLRLFVFNLLLMIIGVLFLILLNNDFYILFLSIHFLLSYIFVLFSSLMLFPFERLISKYYLSIAKKKIRSYSNLLKIGITGSFGKTSTKMILNSILNEHFNSIATEKSFNTPLGISRTINYNLTNLHEVFICEMGAKKVGEIKELCEFVDVDMGIVTSVGRQHLQTFGSIENVYRTKKELPDYLNNKFCVFNLNNFYTRKMYDEYAGEKCGVYFLTKSKNKKSSKIKNGKVLLHRNVQCIANKRYFQLSKQGVLLAKDIFANRDGLTFKVYNDCSYLFTCNSQLIGIHNVTNILLAIAIALKLNVPIDKIKEGVFKIISISARIERNTASNGAIILNNGYNANLDSSKSTLSVLSLFDCKNKVVITPGLIECNDSFKDNFEFGELVGKFATDVIVVKEVNKSAITNGLIKSGFDVNKITYVDSFNDCKNIIDNANDEYVFLIENDLPDNYR